LHPNPEKDLEEAPGEKLLRQMWRSLVDNGIGRLLKPWQTRREGRALADVKREEMLLVAQAQRDAEDILAGRKRLADPGRLALLPGAAPQPDSVLQMPEQLAEGLKALLSDAVLGDALRKEVNVARALVSAESALEGETQEPTTREIEADWLHRWRESAGAVRAEELQVLWGQVLAGEVKSPGTFSLRTIDFLRNLSQEDALAITRLARFVVLNNQLISSEADEILKSEGVDFGFLLSMQELGLISGVGGLGLRSKLGSSEEGSPTYIRGITSHGKVLLVTHEDRSRILELEGRAVTKLGQQVLQLGRGEPHMEYLVALGRRITAKGFKVEIGDVLDQGSARFKVINRQSLDEVSLPRVAQG
jgi:hypothetical protein